MTIPVCDFSKLKIKELIICNVIEKINIKELLRTIVFSNMRTGFAPSAANQSSILTTNQGSVFAGASDFFFVPHNIIQGKSYTKQDSYSSIVVDNLRDGVSRVQTPMYIGDWVRFAYEGEPYNFVAIFNPTGVFKITVMSSPQYEYTFGLTNYSYYIILPSTYSADIKLTAVTSGLIGELYPGMTYYAPSTQQPGHAELYEHGFKFAPEIVGVDLTSSSGAPAKISRGKRRNFDLHWTIDSDADVDWWEELLYYAHRTKAVDASEGGTPSAWWSYPICCVMNSIAYLFSIGFKWNINHETGQIYGIDISLQQEGLRL